MFLCALKCNYCCWCAGMCLVLYTVLRLCSVCVYVYVGGGECVHVCVRAYAHACLDRLFWTVGEMWTSLLRGCTCTRTGRQWSVVTELDNLFYISLQRLQTLCPIWEDTFWISLRNLSLGVCLQQQWSHCEMLWTVNSWENVCFHKKNVCWSSQGIFVNSLAWLYLINCHFYKQNLMAILEDPSSIQRRDFICTYTELVFHIIPDCLISLHNDTSRDGTITLQAMSHCINAVCWYVQAQKTITT